MTRPLIELVTHKVLEQLKQDEEPCGGCALRTCAAGQRACDTIAQQQKIPVGVSARHAHVTQEHLEILYGEGHQLTVHAPLYQPGAFAAKETLTVVGRRMQAIEGLRILGPVRDYSQVELAQTDAIRLGLKSTDSRFGRSRRFRVHCIDWSPRIYSLRRGCNLCDTASSHDSPRCGKLGYT